MAERRDVIDPILLGATKLGGRLSRNNSGLAHHLDGSKVRYGLFVPGGSDCIGWMPRTMTAADAGRTFAIFTAIEAKTERVVLTPEQRLFLDLVNKAGGIGLWGRDAAVVCRSWRSTSGHDNGPQGYLEAVAWPLGCDRV